MGEMRSPPPSVNVRYFEKLAKKDWLKNLQTAYFSQRVSLKHARTKSHFVRYFGSASRNTHVIEQIARTLLPSEVVDLAEAQLAKRIEASMVATDKATARAQTLLQAEAITALPEYLQRPLEVEAKCTSPKVTRYLELILKADRLLTYLEALRLAGAIGTNAYDHQVTVPFATWSPCPGAPSTSRSGCASALRRRPTPPRRRLSARRAPAQTRTEHRNRPRPPQKTRRAGPTPRKPSRLCRRRRSARRDPRTRPTSARRGVAARKRSGQGFTTGSCQTRSRRFGRERRQRWRHGAS